MTDYLTADLPGTGGEIKTVNEDFHVREIPLYEPCGEGEHVYLEFEKSGLTTLEAIRRISNALNAPEREIGYAGLKDARGVTQQTISVPRVDPAAALALEIPGIRMISALRHKNKLRVGHLKGNEFRIVIRDVVADAAERAEKVLDILVRRGMPNFFGEQRYGAHGNSHIVGRHLVTGSHKEAVDAIIGLPEQIRDERWQAAVSAYHEGSLEESARLMPGHCRTERDLLRRLIAKPGDYKGAVKGVHPRLKSLFISAWQSHMFDQVVMARLSSLDRLIPGDVAWKHDNGACFSVSDPAAEQTRAEAFEISPTGPLFGPKMKETDGEQREIEAAVLAAEGVSADLLKALPVDGARRPLRVPLTSPRVSTEGDTLVITFTLPKGSYATIALGEIMKSALPSLDSAAP